MPSNSGQRLDCSSTYYALRSMKYSAGTPFRRQMPQAGNTLRVSLSLYLLNQVRRVAASFPRHSLPLL